MYKLYEKTLNNLLQVRKLNKGAGEVAQQVRAAVKPKGLSLISGTHMREGEK